MTYRQHARYGRRSTFKERDVRVRFCHIGGAGTQISADAALFNLRSEMMIAQPINWAKPRGGD